MKIFGALTLTMETTLMFLIVFLNEILDAVPSTLISFLHGENFLVESFYLLIIELTEIFRKMFQMRLLFNQLFYGSFVLLFH